MVLALATYSAWLDTAGKDETTAYDETKTYDLDADASVFWDDWLGTHTTAYATYGRWFSPVIDVRAATDKNSGKVTVQASVGAGQAVKVQTRTSPDGLTWTEFQSIDLDGSILSPGDNYLQLLVELYSESEQTTPSVSSISVTFDQQPSMAEQATGYAETAEAFFCTFTDLCIMVNGVDVPQKWDAVNPWTALGGSPPAARYVALHQNRLWLASSSANPSRIWFSELLDPETWPALNFIDVAPDDGDRITGLIPVADVLVVMKGRSTWLLLGDSPSNFQVRCVNPSLGSPAPRSLCNMDGKLVFASSRGVHLTDMTGFATMSERLRPTWESMNARRYGRAVGAFAEHMLYIFVPAAGSLENNSCLVYDTIRQAFTMRPWGASCWAEIEEAGKVTTLFGDPERGQVFSLDSTSDRGAVVPFAWESKAFDFGARESLKLARRVLLQVKPNGVAGQLKCYLRPDQGTLKGPTTVTYPGSSEIATLQFIAGAIGVGPFKTLSVRIENATKDARPEVHSIAIEYLVAKVEVE